MCGTALRLAEPVVSKVELLTAYVDEGLAEVLTRQSFI
jgi:hypothetical protein